MNASADQHDSYILAELRDQNDNVIPGFEKEKCIFTNTDNKSLPLRWNNKSPADIDEKQNTLRLYFRNAKLYNQTSKLPVAK